MHDPARSVLLIHELLSLHKHEGLRAVEKHRFILISARISYLNGKRPVLFRDVPAH
jgi:hypothetical protein